MPELATIMSDIRPAGTMTMAYARLGHDCYLESPTSFETVVHPFLLAQH